MRVLVVEDEDRVASFIKRGLEEEEFEVEVASDGPGGLTRACQTGYEALLLDVNLPGKDGFEVLTELRAAGITSPVMMLTVRGSVEDKVRALNAGADDYLPKPFAFDELVARVRALVRRNRAADPADTRSVLEAYGIRMDRTSHRVTRDGVLIQLTGTEYNLLELLLKHPDEVMPRARIAEEVWGYNFDVSTNIVEVYVAYLRRKIDRPFSQKLIQNVRGVGYSLRRDDSTAPEVPLEG
ncbi:MAG TPA: response regulator transcription factor [Armatimonadota bacterium]|jgi:two-component system OmpR family response regulator